ncbi:hypothetical protein BW737_001785 [Actinomyces ruminis]|uniref:Uncharacterized protein n=1 Tax=Actinomyces ruminis TaxID=1937003 RepID=A0ABX4MDJ0_9ACTO|nr:hypothetical protein BW737_001785 [Actinomyces ruminis]
MVTAESLSTDRYVVTSIPEDLDEKQTEVLKAFVNYDQVTWNIWFTREGVENAEPLMTDEAYQILKDNYEDAVEGYTDGTVRIAVTSVYLTSLYARRPKPRLRSATTRPTWLIMTLTVMTSVTLRLYREDSKKL